MQFSSVPDGNSFNVSCIVVSQPPPRRSWFVIEHDLEVGDPRTPRPLADHPKASRRYSFASSMASQVWTFRASRSAAISPCVVVIVYSVGRVRRYDTMSTSSRRMGIQWIQTRISTIYRAVAARQRPRRVGGPGSARRRREDVATRGACGEGRADAMGVCLSCEESTASRGMRIAKRVVLRQHVCTTATVCL